MALGLVCGSQEVCAQPTQTLLINTGLVGQSGSTLTAFLQPDDGWRVIQDPLNPTVRPAIVVDYTSVGHYKWPIPLPNSRWISTSANKYLYVLPPPRTTFVYRLCFNLPVAFSAPNLSMQLRADDIVRRIKLNNKTIFEDHDPTATAAAGTAKPGSHIGPPVVVGWTTDFQGGQNCLDVTVEDVQQVITGLNVVGTVTYQQVVSLAPCPLALMNATVEADLSTGTNGNPPVDVAPGSADPKWFLASSPNLGPSAAYVTNPTSSVFDWPIRNPTQPANWIQRKQNVSPQRDAPGLYVYRILFGLNAGSYSSIQLTLRYAADNVAVVKLNNQQIASCGAEPPCFYLTSHNWTNVLTVATGFLSVNTLEVAVTNNIPVNSPSLTGLIVDAKLRATCWCLICQQKFEPR